MFLKGFCFSEPVPFQVIFVADKYVWFFLTFWKVFCFLEESWKISFLFYVFFPSSFLSLESKREKCLLLYQFYLYVINKRHFVQMLGWCPDAGCRGQRVSCIVFGRHMSCAGPTPFLRRKPWVSGARVYVFLPFPRSCGARSGMFIMLSAWHPGAGPEPGSDWASTPSHEFSPLCEWKDKLCPVFTPVPKSSPHQSLQRGL